MTNHLIQSVLTDEQKGQICGILSVGCDRETAADFVGCAIPDIGRAMQQDTAFAANVRRTEAGSELSHMRNVQQAAKEAKNWRASIWWLERHSPERFGPRGAGEVTVRQLKEFVDTLSGIFHNEIRDEEDRRRVIFRMDQAISTIDRLVRSSVPGAYAELGELPAENEEAAWDDEPANLLAAPDEF